MRAARGPHALVSIMGHDDTDFCPDCSGFLAERARLRVPSATTARISAAEHAPRAPAISIAAHCANNAPCECRASASDTAANECISVSNCRVDADCGENEYCSPSQLSGICFCPSAALCGADSACSPGPCACGDACGHGYFCRTPTDACVDDSDCGTSGSCNYDTVNQRWACSECW